MHLDARLNRMSCNKLHATASEGLQIMKKKGQNKGKISDGKISFYDSDGLNKAHYPAEKTIEALINTKKMIEAAGGYDEVRRMTLEKF